MSSVYNILACLKKKSQIFQNFVFALFHLSIVVYWSWRSKTFFLILCAVLYRYVIDFICQFSDNMKIVNVFFFLRWRSCWLESFVVFLIVSSDNWHIEGNFVKWSSRSGLSRLTNKFWKELCFQSPLSPCLLHVDHFLQHYSLVSWIDKIRSCVSLFNAIFMLWEKESKNLNMSVYPSWAFTSFARAL